MFGRNFHFARPFFMLIVFQDAVLLDPSLSKQTAIEVCRRVKSGIYVVFTVRKRVFLHLVLCVSPFLSLLFISFFIGVYSKDSRNTRTHIRTHTERDGVHVKM